MTGDLIVWSTGALVVIAGLVAIVIGTANGRAEDRRGKRVS